MTPEKTLLLLGPTTSVVERAKSLGLDVILVQHKAKYTREQADLADLVFIADITDWSAIEPIAEAAHEKWGFAAALSLTDPGVVAAARINDKYGLGGTSYEICSRFVDKLAMRRTLAAAEDGPVAIGAEPLVNRESLEEFGQRYGFPFIVKPTDAAASLGIHLVTGPAQFDDVLAAVAELQATGTQRGCGGLFTITDHLIEEYATGQEFSVEGFSFGGRHVIVAITEKLTSDNHFAELGHTIPARVSEADEAAIVAATERFLTVMGLTDGPSHTEIRLDPRGPVIIEGHNRLGGHPLDVMMANLYGVDLKTYAVGWPFGLVDELPGRPRTDRAATMRVPLIPPGRVTAIHGLDEIRAHPDALQADLVFRVGDVVPALRDNHDLSGLVVVTGPDGDAAVKLCDELITTTLRVEVDGP